MPKPAREYELAEDADGDLLASARYTIKEWGFPQTRRYEAALKRCFAAIGHGKVRGRMILRHRPELLFVHCEHHFIFYVVRPEQCPLIGAVLHERMDLMTRLKERLRS
jgi:plasmid stabilization system protein ParE